MQKVAVAIIHGMGNQKDDYADKCISLIKENFTKKLTHLTEDVTSQLVIEPVFWAEVFEKREDCLFDKYFDKCFDNHELNYKELRKFVIQYLGDTIAYQPIKSKMQNYERVHQKIKTTLTTLSKKAGDQAPLCVISHSLGSAIASNFFYDLEDSNSGINECTPIEKGETLTLFYTLGTTLPLWSLRYHDFNEPINIPSKSIQNFHPNLKGEWVNFYDKDDILGYPLKTVNDSYKHAVDEDRGVSVGGLLTGWNPSCHNKYLTDIKVIERIVDGLIETWKHVNNI